MDIKHVISTKQFLKRELLEEIFRTADEYQKKDEAGKLSNDLHGRILATVFYEPSTRTRFSFESATFKLGGEVISTENADQFSSAIKGETIEDTIRIVGGYADFIVLRHHEVGTAEKAAGVSSVPVINAGDGSGEHPTQALLDIYTIKKELKTIDNLKIALIGDLLNGRTIHSLIHLISLCKNAEVFLVSPAELNLPDEYKSFLRSKKIKFAEFNKLDEILPIVDVLYVTRIQKERFKSMAFYNQIKDYFIVDADTLKLLNKKAIIMHPLPRVNEITREVDLDVRAAYFRQAKNGMYVRMALLKLISDNLKKRHD